MFRKKIWLLAIALTLVFAFEPFVLSLIWNQPRSWDRFIRYMIDVPISIITVSVIGLIEAAVLAVVPFRQLSYFDRVKWLLPIVVSITVGFMIFAWAQMGYYEARYNMKLGPGR